MPEPIVVLQVDDEPDFLELSAELIEREDDGIEVVTAAGTDEGLARLADGGVDCVVSDFDMPDRDGIEFLDLVREEHGDLPFVLFTGKGSEEVASDAIAAGATDYLQKGSGVEQYELLANRVRNAVEQHRAEVERLRNERRFEAVFEDPEMLVALLDPDGTLEQVNGTAMSFVDADLEAVLGEPFWETPWWTDELRDDVREWVRRAAEGEYVEYEDEQIRPEGHPGSAHGTVRPVTDEDGNVESLIVSARDTTELQRRKRRFEAVFDNTLQFMGLTAPDGTVLEVNETALSYGGLAAEDVVGEPLWEADWFAGEARERIRRAVERSRDGELFREEVAVQDGDHEAVVDLSMTPVHDEQGSVALLVPEGHDVTERRRREQELRRTNERLEAFAEVVSHDLQGPLGVLDDSLEQVAETGDEEHIERCRRSVRQMERIVGDLLALARSAEPVADPQPVALADAATAAWQSVDAGDASLRVDADAVVDADAASLERLLANLLGNAVQHGGEGVTVTVGDSDGGFFVADDGPGIPLEDAEAVFESGYTTDEDGTGLGLSIVRRIVEAHGWTITVTGSDDGGARFDVTGVDRHDERAVQDDASR